MYDIFPLDKGMHYTYSFYQEDKVYVLMALTQIHSDSGDIEYIILDSLQYGDTLKIWNIEQRRKILHWDYFVSWDTSYFIVDTSYYSLYEYLDGNHELKCSLMVWQFPITHWSGIDSSIFRYSDFENILIAHSFQQNNDYWRDSIWFSNEAGMYRRVTDSYSNPGINQYTYKRYLQRSDITIDVKQSDGNVVKDYILSQNYPNPFNPTTTIEFSIPQTSYVTLEVFNTLGERVGVLASEELVAGTYKYNWDASDLTSGIYFYQLRVYPAGGGAGSFVETRKMILLK